MGHSDPDLPRLELSRESLGSIDSNGGRHAGPESLGPAHERFADGYRHSLGTLARDPVANQTITRALATIPE
ncbi:MAG: hypothetical protein AB1938_26095 [Myxococcota bacterium]